MDVSAYYYNYYYYNVPTSLPTYEFYPYAENSEAGIYDAQSNAVEGPLNLNEEQINPILGEDEACDDPDSIPLPQELTKMFKPLECELCGVSVICHTSAFTHYEGKTHIKNVNAYMKEHYNVYGSLKIKKERFTPVRCDICNIELSSKVVYQQHFSGKQHMKNLRKKQYSVPMEPSYDLSKENDILSNDLPPPPPPPKLSDYVCEVCGISTNTEQQMNFHKNGQKHKKKLAKLNQYKLENALNSFYNNEWPDESGNSWSPEADNSVSFIENPEMDHPLEFNDCQEDNYEEDVNDGEIESENQNENLDKKNTTDSTQEIIPSSLEPKTYELPIELEIENEKLISSTGIILQQLSFVQHTVNSNSEDNSSLKCNVPDGDSSINKELVENSTENCISDTQEKCMSEESSVASDEASKVISTAQILESNAVSSSCGLEEQKLDLDKQKTMKTTMNDELNKDSQENAIISDVKMGENNNESTSNPTILEKENDKTDQVLTKLAIEEIEKEGISYEKTRVPKTICSDSDNNIASDNKQSCTEDEKMISKYKYDKAGYRINEDTESNTNDKENGSDRRRYDNNEGNYYNRDRFGKRNYNYRWNNYENWNTNNYKMYNNNYFYRNRDDRNNNSYWRYNSRNYNKSNKRKRDESYYSDEERRRDNRYDKDEERKRDRHYNDEERKRDDRYDKDEERKRDRHYNDEERKRDRHGNDEERKRDRHYDDEERKRYKYDDYEERKRDRYYNEEERKRDKHGDDEERKRDRHYNEEERKRYKYDDDRKKRDYRHDKDERRKRNKYENDEERSYQKSRKSHKDEKKYSKRKTRRSSSRNRRDRSYSSDSSYSSRSRSESSTDRDRSKKSKKSDKSSTRNKEKKYKSSPKNRDHSESDSSSSNSDSNSSNNHDYRLDQNGMCEKQHRCEKAYISCPYKHKKPFKSNEEFKRTESIEKEESWNPEAPVINEESPFEIKIKKENDEEDAALSAYRTSSGTYYCKYCIVSTKSNEMFREHLQTPKHTLLMKFKNKI